MAGGDSAAPVTTWVLITSTALAALGWVTSTLRDRRTADSVIVTAAGELVDRLRVEIDRLYAEVVELRAEVEQCQQRHAEVVATIGRLTTDP